MDSPREVGQKFRAPCATARRICPHPIPEKGQIEALRAARAHVTPFAPIISDQSPHSAWKINITRKVEPNDGLSSRQTKIKMGCVVAIHDPGIAGSRLGHPLAKSPGLGLHPAGIPIDCVEMYDRQAKPLANAPRKRRLASPARPEDENTLRYGHRTLSRAEFAIAGFLAGYKGRRQQ